MSKKNEKVTPTPHPLTSDFDGLPTPRVRFYPNYFIKMTSNDVKEITYMPLITFFSVLERPGKTRTGVQPPPLPRLDEVDLINIIECNYDIYILNCVNVHIIISN